MNETSLAVSSCSSDLPCTEERVTEISVVALLQPLPLLLVHWPVFLVLPGRCSEPSDHSTYGCAILEELHHLSNFFWLQISL